MRVCVCVEHLKRCRTSIFCGGVQHLWRTVRNEAIATGGKGRLITSPYPLGSPWASVDAEVRWATAVAAGGLQNALLLLLLSSFGLLPSGFCLIMQLVQACVQSKDLNLFFASVCVCVCVCVFDDTLRKLLQGVHKLNSFLSFNLSYLLCVCMCNCDLEERAKRRQKGLDRCRMMARARKHKGADSSSYYSWSRFSD